MRMFYGQMQLSSRRYIPSAFIQWEHWMQSDNSPSSETKEAYVKMFDGQQPGWSLLFCYNRRRGSFTNWVIVLVGGIVIPKPSFINKEGYCCEGIFVFSFISLLKVFIKTTMFFQF